MEKTPFQSTHPVWGATGCPYAVPWWIYHFNPRTPCGVRRSDCCFGRRAGLYFNPRTPCGVRRSKPSTASYAVLFQSTHPVWGATPFHVSGNIRLIISIHAPRVGCDIICVQAHLNFLISIHAPRVGCDENPFETQEVSAYFNPRTPCGVRPGLSFQSLAVSRFQSTHPVWGAT